MKYHIKNESLAQLQAAGSYDLTDADAESLIESALQDIATDLRALAWEYRTIQRNVADPGRLAEIERARSASEARECK